MPYSKEDLLADLGGATPSGEKPLVNESEGYSKADLLGDLYGGDIERNSPQAIDQEVAQERRQNALPKTWFGEIASGFGRGVDQMQQTLYGVGALASDTLGLDSLTDKFAEAVAQQDKEIAENPTNVGSFEDVDNFDSFMRYTFGSVGEVAPNLLESVVTGVAGGLVGSRIGPQGAATGGVAGFIGKRAARELIKEGVEKMVGKEAADEVKSQLADYAKGVIVKEGLDDLSKSLLANQSRKIAGRYGATTALAMSSVSQEVGSIYNDLQKDPNLAESDRKIAAIVGGITAAIPEVFFEGWIASKFFKGAKDIPKEEVDAAKNYLLKFTQNYGKEILKTVPGESGQELLQTITEEAAKNWADPNRRENIFAFTPEQKAQFIDASFKGAIGGALGGSVAAVGETALRPHPNPQVRQFEKDIETRADDLSGPTIDIELGEDDERLSAIGTRRAAVEEELAKPETTPEQKAILSAELEKLNQDENEILGNQAAETEALVNEKEPDILTPEERAIKENMASGTLTPIEKADTHLRALLANKMGNRKVAEVTESIDPTQVARKRAELETLVNENVRKSRATPEEKSQYIKAHMEAFDDATLNFLAKEGVSVRKITKGESKRRFDKRQNYAAFDDDQGNIVLTIPDLDTVQTDTINAASGPIGVAKAQSSDIERTKTVIGHELIHVADLVNIRRDFKTNGKEGESFSDFESRYIAERGRVLREALPYLPKQLHHTYLATEGKADDRVIGQEFMRMMVEAARTGTLTEVTSALVRKQSEAQGNERGIITEYLSKWIGAIRSLHKTLLEFFNPDTAPAEIVNQFNQINEVLDRYGVLVNEKQEQPARRDAVESTQETGETVSPSVEKSSLTVGDALLSNAKVEQAGQRGRLVEEDGELILRTPAQDFLIQDAINRDTSLAEMGIKVLRPSRVKELVRQAKEELDAVDQIEAAPIIAAETVPAEPQFYIDASTHPTLNALYDLIEVGQSRQPRARKLIQETPEYKRLLRNVTPEMLNRAENIVLTTIDRVESMNATQERKDQLAQPFYELWNGIDTLRQQLTQRENEQAEAAAREIPAVLPAESNESQPTPASEETPTAEAPKRKRLTKEERAKQKLDKAITAAKNNEARIADAMRAYIDYQRSIGEDPTGRAFKELFGKGATIKLFNEVLKGAPLVNEKRAAQAVLNYNSFWINNSGKVIGSISQQAHADVARQEIGKVDDVNKAMADRGWMRGAVRRDTGQILINAKSLITPSARRVLQDMAEERGLDVVNEATRNVIASPGPIKRAAMMEQTEIADQLGLDYNGVFMEKLDMYTDKDPDLGSTFTVPLDSQIDVVREARDAKREEFRIAREMFGDDKRAAQAGRPILTKRDQQELTKALRESNRIHNQQFATLPIKERETKRVKGEVPWEHATPMELWYATRPHTESAVNAQLLVNERGDALTVAEMLRNDVQGESLGLADGRYGPDSKLKAVYENVIMQLISTERQLMLTEASIGSIGYLRDLRRTLEERMRVMGNETGSFNAYTGMSEKLYTGETARREYVDTLVENSQEVIGRDAKTKLTKLTAELNGLWNKYAGVVVNRPKVIALIRKIEKLVDKKKFAKGYRKTVTQSIDKLKLLTQKAAARAADYMSLDKEGEAYVNRAIERMTAEMTGVPKDEGTKTELQVFQSVIQRMAKQVGTELGIISPAAKQKTPSMLEQMTAILKNERLYSMFVNGLYKSYIEEYGGRQPSEQFLEQAEIMYARLASRAWTEDMVKTLVNEKMREINQKFAQIAKSHYSAGTEAVDNLIVQIGTYMKEQGVDNPALVEQLAQDIENNMLERIENAREKFFASKATIRDFLRRAQTTLAQAAKEHSTYIDGLEKEFEKILANQYGLPNTDELPIARSVAKAMQAEFNELVQGERAKILERWKAEQGKGKSDQTQRGLNQMVNKVIQLANLGAMRTEEVYSALAEKFNLPKYDKKVAEEIEQIGNAIGEANLPRQKQILTQQLSDLIAAKRGMKTSDAFTSWMYFSMLSGPGTQFVNIGGNLTSLMGYVLIESIKHPARAPRMLAALIRTAIGKAQIEARESFFTGYALGKQGEKYYRVGNPAELADPFFKSGWKNESLAKADEKLAKLSHTVIRGVKGYYVGRALMATDIFFYKIAQEMAYQARTGGFTLTPSMWDSAMKKAGSEMRALGQNPDENSDMKRRQQILAHEEIERARLFDSDGLVNESRRSAWDESNQEALDATFSQEPTGFLGYLAKHLERFTADWPIGKLIIPFTRVAANVANQMLEWTPYGFARYAFMSFKEGESLNPFEDFGKWKFKQSDSTDVALRAALGTAAIFGLLALVASERDEEDPFFTIYGDGPRDINARRQLQQRGWKPNTIKLGNSYVSYLYTPLAMALSIVGRHMDDYRDGRLKDPRDLSFSTSAVALIDAVKNQSFLASAADLMSAVDSPDPVAKFSRGIARMATIPIPNIVKQVDRLVDPSIQEAEGFWESVVKEVPIARHKLKPAINIFGEEVERTPGLVKFPGADRFLTMRKTDDPVLNLLSEKRLVVPGVSKSTKLGENNLTPEQYYEYVQMVGPKVKRRIEAEIQSLNAMDSEAAQERLERISLEEKKKARTELKAKYSR